jgi:GNAT superfamily N-acetyltransferase
VGGEFAGYLTVVCRSGYPPFREVGIPEIRDFNVLPGFRRRGIGTCLVGEAEALIYARSPVAGIEVGMADGRGLTSYGRFEGRGAGDHGRWTRPVSHQTPALSPAQAKEVVLRAACLKSFH